MNEIELDIMKGLVSILNEASHTYEKTGQKIMTDAQFDARLCDLKQLEQDTGFVLMNSPTCQVNVQSIVEYCNFETDKLKECDNIEDIFEFCNQKEVVEYIDINGADMLATYTNGYVSSIKINNANAIDLSMFNDLRLPYRIKKDESYIVNGKATIADKPIFYVTNVVEGGGDTLKNNLDEAKTLGFDVVPFWLTTNLDSDSKNVKRNINYVSEYAKEDGLQYNGIVFKFNDINYGSSLSAIKFAKSQNE